MIEKNKSNSHPAMIEEQILENSVLQVRFHLAQCCL